MQKYKKFPRIHLNIKRVIFTLTIISIFVMPVYARLIFAPIDIDELTRQSDVVAVGNLKNVSETTERTILPIPGGKGGIDVVGMEAVFGITTVFKGKIEEKDIILHYYKYAEPPRVIINGPGFLYLDINSNKAMEQSTGREISRSMEYLLFLKQENDGRYMPTSGYFDSGFSVRRIEFGSE